MVNALSEPVSFNAEIDSDEEDKKTEPMQTETDATEEISEKLQDSKITDTASAVHANKCPNTSADKPSPILAVNHPSVQILKAAVGCTYILVL